jgi:hypothetical protein
MYDHAKRQWYFARVTIKLEKSSTVVLFLAQDLKLIPYRIENRLRSEIIVNQLVPR